MTSLAVYRFERLQGLDKLFPYEKERPTLTRLGFEEVTTKEELSSKRLSMEILLPVSQ